MIIQQDIVGLTLKVDVGRDVSAYSEYALLGQKGRVVKKITGSLEGTQVISATVPAGFFSELGDWRMEALVEGSGGEYFPGKAFFIKVIDNIKEPT